MSETCKACEGAGCGVCDPPPPQHPFEVRIHIGGDDWEYVVRTMRELADHIEKCGPDCTMMSGGGGGSHSVTIQTREISKEDFRRELQTWHEGLPVHSKKALNG